MYAKDISTKIKSTLHTKARRGEYLGALDPYGYLRHPDDKHKLIINEETAPVVRRMFEMCAAGIGSKSIATTLNREGILSHKRELKQAILIKQLYETLCSDCPSSVFSVIKISNILHLQNQQRNSIPGIESFLSE